MQIRAKNIFIYIVEGVPAVAWQQCKQSLNDARQREGYKAATGWKTGWRKTQLMFIH